MAIGAAPAEPLTPYPLASCTDADEFLQHLAKAYEIKSPPRPVSLPDKRDTHVLRGVPHPHFTVGYLRSSLGTQLGAAATNPYLIHLGSAGGLHVTRGSQHVVTAPSVAAVINPGDPHLAVPDPGGAAIFSVALSRSLVDQELAALLNRPLDGTVRFDLALDLGTPATTGLRRALDGLLANMELDDQVLRHPAVQLGQIRNLATCLLLSHRHSYSEALLTDQAPARPRTLRRALDFIEANLDQPMAPGDITAAAGCQARTLFLTFQEYLGESPMNYVRRRRLECARDDLLHTDDPVTDVALRWGFSHLGRFASSYRRRFGELPSQTVARR
jgi:AraC-like DNA-binding protein